MLVTERGPLARATVVALAVMITSGLATGPVTAPAALPVMAPVSVSAATAASTISVPAVADTYVVAERPSVAYGTETKLTAAAWATWHSETYLRFQVPATPPGRRVLDAHLDLTFQRLSQQPPTVELRTVAGGWNEATVYGGRPTVGAVLATATLAGQNTPSMSFDLTSLVRVGGEYAVAMTNPNVGTVASVYSREHGDDGPRLVIQYSERTLCGAAFTDELPGESYQQALAREDGYYDGLEIARVFYANLPRPWPGKLDTAGRPMVISFKAPPADVLAGTDDAQLRTWFRQAPVDQDIYWTYWHEPENNVESGDFTPGEFRAAWQRIAGLAREAANPRLHATLILMGWTVNPASGRNWLDYYPGAADVEVLGWDVYNSKWDAGTPAYVPAANLFARVIATSQAAGKPFGIAETGSPRIPGDAGAQRAAWLTDVAQVLTEAGARFVAYFDLDWTAHGAGDYRLRDEPSMGAWRAFCS